MADVNANIGVNIDTSLALAQLKSLQRQISQFHTSISKSSESAAIAQKSLQKNLLNSVNSIGAFSAELRTVKTSAESFTSSLEGNKFSMREYFRYAGASTKTFGKLFKSEFDTIGKVAEERVKKLQTQYIKLGRNTSGAMQAMAITPTSLNMNDYSTKVAMAAQKQALFNQLMKQGSTNLLNFGKNTQWAGRQLMVGFTIPLSIVGAAATKTFMEMEAQALKFKKVYGDLFTPQEETQAALDNITELGRQFTKYGIAVSQTVGLASEAAAAGFQGLDLQRQTTEATRLSVLGQIDSQKALETTIALQNAFGMSSENLAGSIDFLNAVENQTVVSLDDITTAIPKVAPVIQQLGGDVKDLTFFIAAMKEGGINASEGANALKSGLAALINPTGRASAMLKSFGINATEIVTKNKGNLKATVIEFATALNQLDPLNRAQAIEQMFGKFQFARLSTLFANVAKDGNQAARVLDLANSSVEDLSALSEKELGMTAESSMNKFKKTVEDLKVSLIPVGKAFLEAVTPILEFVAKILDKFGNLSDGTKKVVTLITLGIAGLAPIFLMTFGLLANLLANSVKGAMILRNGYLRLTGQSQILGEQTQYLTTEQLDAAAAAHSLDQSHAKLTQQFTAEASAVAQLIAAYQQATAAGQKFMLNNPGMMSSRKGYASGIVSVPGSGKGDTVPAMLTPGEAVIPAAMAKKYAPLIQGMIAGNIPGYDKGRTGTEGTNVKIPGGFAAAHFGGSNQMSGNDLLSMIEGRSDKMAQSLRKMVESLASADEKLTVFTNEVIATSSDLNEAVGKTGSGKTVTKKYAMTEMLDPQYAKVRDIELQRQLETAGKPIEEIRDVNEKITEEIANGFEKLKDKTLITAEDLDKLISEAYEKIAKTDKDVKAAYERMKEITTVTDPNLLTRRPVTKKSYKDFRKNNQKTGTSPYYQGMERMAGEGNVPYNPQANFRITNPMADQIGLSSKDASLVYNQFSKEVKLKLSKLKGDIAGFTAEFQKEAEIAGLKTGKAYTTGIDKSAIADPYIVSRDRNSPHRLAEEDGKNDALAYETAVQKSIDRNQRKRSRQGGSVYIANGAPVSPGIKMSDATANMSVNPIITRGVVEQAKAMQIATDRIRSFDRNLMGASFAISSLSGLASMSGGKFGELSGTIAKVTGALFALSAVTSLLTQMKLLELAQTRIGLASAAMKMAKGGGGISAMPGLVGKSGVLGGLARVGFGLLKLAGPIGIATTVATGLYIGFRYLKKTQEESRQKLEAFTDALVNSADQIKSLGDYFGVIPTKTNLESTKPQLVVDKNTRAELDKFKESDTFKKDFAGTSKALSRLSNKDATLALQSKGQELLGKGFSKQQVSIIIRAIQEEAGKTGLKINFAKIDVDKLNKTLQSELAKKFADLPKFINDNLEKTPVRDWENDKWIVKLLPGKKIEAELKKSATLFKTYLNGIDGMFKSGQISSKKFNELFGEALTSITSNVPLAKDQILLLSAALGQMDSPLAQIAATIKDLKTQTVLLESAILGVVVGKAALNALVAAAANPYDTQAQISKPGVLAEIKNLNELKKIAQEAANKITKDFVPGGGDEKDGALTRAQDFIALQEQLIDMQSAPQLKKYNDELERQDGLLKDINKTIESRTEELITPLEATLKENAYLIDQISIKEDAINEHYDLQIKSLSEIKSINEDIASSEKERLSVAGALSSGDISAAASAVEEARARASSTALTRAESSLTKSRDLEIKALGRNELEKENKQIQLDIATIQREKIEPLNQEKIAIEKNIAAQNDLKDALVKSVDLRKSEVKELGMTKIQIDEAAKALDLAQNPNVNIKDPSFLPNVIKAALGDAYALKAALDAVAGKSKISFKDEESTKIKEIVKTKNTDLSDYQDAFMRPGTRFGLAKGGVVPRYFASGGLSQGTDTVPAMLTPGEFVIKKSTVDEYGQDFFNNLNSQKFKGDGPVRGYFKGGLVSSLFKKVPSVAGAAGIWQSMEELEKLLSLKYGASEKDSGLEKWTKAIGRVGFNTAQGTLTGLPFGSPFAGLAEGLVEGIVGISKDGSQYGVKGGSYSNPKGTKATNRGFNAQKELDNMSFKNSGLNILKTMGISVPFGVASNVLAPLIGKVMPKIMPKISKKSESGVVLSENKEQIEKIIDSIYSKESLQTENNVTSSYKINGKDFVFQGKGEDLSELIGYDLNVVPTNPIELLEAALKLSPNSKNLKTLQNNFKNNKIGEEELTLLDQITASVNVSNSGYAGGYVNPDGFAMMLSSLSGNKNAKKIIDAKTKVLIKAIDKNKKEQAEYVEGLNKNFKAGEGLMPADPSTVPVIHSTKYPIVRDKDNNVILHPFGTHTLGTDKAIPRASLHFSLEDTVKDVMGHSWAKTQKKIVTPLSSMIEANGLPHNLYSADTWWMRSPGQPLTLKGASVINPYTDSFKYAEELTKRGLLKEGETPPLISIDPKTKDVLHMYKDSYDDADRQILSDLTKATGRSMTPDYAKGIEDELIGKIAMQEAKSLININTPSQFSDGQGLTSNWRNDELRLLGEKLNIGGGYHSNTPVERLEKEVFTETRQGNLGENAVASYLGSIDNIEALRMNTIHGGFKTGIGRLTRATSDAEDRALTKAEDSIFYDAKGGLIPKHFADGGFAKGTDTVPAMLTPGEFVMSKSSVDKFGPMLAAINSPSFKMPRSESYSAGSSAINSVVDNSSAMYNYNIGITVPQSNASSGDIANAVIGQIKYIDAQRIRGQR